MAAHQADELKATALPLTTSRRGGGWTSVSLDFGSLNPVWANSRFQPGPTTRDFPIRLKLSSIGAGGITRPPHTSSPLCASGGGAGESSLALFEVLRINHGNGIWRSAYSPSQPKPARIHQPIPRKRLSVCLLSKQPMIKNADVSGLTFFSRFPSVLRLANSLIFDCEQTARTVIPASPE